MEAHVSAAASEQVARALSASLPSGELEALLTEVSKEREGLEGHRVKHEARSLDPLIDRKEALAARERADGARFEIARIDVATEKLAAAAKLAKSREQSAASAAAFAKVKAERDKLAEDLKQYPVFARQIVALLERIERNDAAIADVRGPGGEMLISAECLVRNVPAHFRNGSETISRLTTAVLPALSVADPMRPFMWHYKVGPDRRNPG
jgi:hypothetical protein